MTVSLDLKSVHHVVAASSHYYEKPTEELYIDRTLAFHDIIYLIEGEWLFTETIKGKDVNYLLKPNDFLILSAGNHHYTRFPCKKGTKTFCVHITRSDLDMVDGNPDSIKIEPHINCKDAPKVVYYFDKIVKSFWSNSNTNQAEADSYATLLLCELEKINNDMSFSPPVQSVVDLIKNNPQKVFDNEDFEQVSGLNIKKLSSKFKNEVGETLHAYNLNHKLKLIALHLETEPDILLKELATTYGFYDEFYLSKIFKKKYGESPQSYKKHFDKERTGKAQ